MTNYPGEAAIPPVHGLGPAGSRPNGGDASIYGPADRLAVVRTTAIDLPVEGPDSVGGTTALCERSMSAPPDEEELAHAYGAEQPAMARGGIGS